MLLLFSRILIFPSLSSFLFFIDTLCNCSTLIFGGNKKEERPTPLHSSLPLLSSLFPSASRLVLSPSLSYCPRAFMQLACIFPLWFAGTSTLAQERGGITKGSHAPPAFVPFPRCESSKANPPKLSY